MPTVQVYTAERMKLMEDRTLPSDFGCVMNGVLDDSVGFASMCASITAGTSPPKIYIPKGKTLYLAGSGGGEVTLPPLCSIEGAGINASFICLGSDRTLQTTNDGNTIGKISNLTIRGDKTGDRNTTSLLKLRFGAKALLENLRIGYTDGIGIHCDALQNSTFVNILLVYCGSHGLLIENYTLHCTFIDVQTVDCGLNNTLWKSGAPGTGTPDGLTYYGVFIRCGTGGVNCNKLLFIGGGPNDSLTPYSGQLAPLGIEGAQDVVFQGVTFYQQLGNATKRAVVLRTPTSPDSTRFTDGIVFRDCYMQTVTGNAVMDVANLTGQAGDLGVVIEGQTRIDGPNDKILINSDGVKISIIGKQEPRVSITAGGTSTKPVGYYIRHDDPTWTVPTLLNSWVSYGTNQPPRYRKEKDRVFIEGACKTGTHGTAPWQLPEGSRPPADITVPALIEGGGLGYVIVTSAGWVGLYQVTGTITDGIRFAFSFGTT